MKSKLINLLQGYFSSEEKAVDFFFFILAKVLIHFSKYLYGKGVQHIAERAHYMVGELLAERKDSK